ncbi:hypothetical protein JHW45_10645 [Paracoccus stylophorae]|uniref:Uncharacterized protein n=1 Tax=Paracoccus stylophorae TaxID=659350 RepID=A0ABY7SRU7_9RHOB|nr:hypothetical protein [Paracoccus stylophorae]WCR09574.1 hypothetical protein JHW45_10645 [Paracoccus stylophorae]
MTNTYLPEDEWDERRDMLAGTILLREAAGLMAGKPVTNPALVEAALEAAAQQMAEIGLMPETARERIAA